SGGGAVPSHRVLAILPVDNPSGDATAEYLGAGMAAVVAGNLGSISGLTVLSRTSTAPYAARRGDLAAMRREIGADFVFDLVTKATAAVNEALRLDADQAAVHYSLGNMYQQTGRYEDAITALNRAIQIQPDDDESHALLARVLAAKGDYQRASEEARRAVDIRPGWTGYFNQGRVELAGGHLDKALVAFRRTTELNPGFAGGFQMLGAAYQMTGDLDNAIGNYEHSIRLEPNAPAYSNLGI